MSFGNQHCFDEIAALISVATIIGNSIVEWATRYCGKRTTLLCMRRATVEGGQDTLS